MGIGEGKIGSKKPDSVSMFPGGFSIFRSTNPLMGLKGIIPPLLHRTKKTEKCLNTRVLMGGLRQGISPLAITKKFEVIEGWE